MLAQKLSTRDNRVACWQFTHESQSDVSMVGLSQLDLAGWRRDKSLVS